MKKLICKVMLTAMIFSTFTIFTACNGNSPSSDNAGKTKAKLVCGVTDFEPMNYKDDNGNWTGFDTDFAKLVGAKLNMDVEFQEIEWDQRYNELNSGNIDCIWNGFTANSTDDGRKRSDFVDFSYGYMLNQQCVVIKKENADKFKRIEDLKGKTAAAEKGSAGEDTAKKAIGKDENIITCEAQIDAFMEVKTGAVDCAVVDILLAQRIAGAGDYSDLAIANISLNSEIYAIGFKKGSPLTAKVNSAMKELFADGKMEALAKKYNLENSLKLDTATKY